MKTIAPAVVVLACLTSPLYAQEAVEELAAPMPPTVIMYTVLGTGRVADVRLACVNEDKSEGAGCYGRDGGVPTWTVIRCDERRCYRYPFEVDSPTQIHFRTGKPGTYYVRWRSFDQSLDARTVLQRDEIEYPPSIQP